MHIIIVGGSDAGTEAALAARRTDPSAEITMLVADEYVNYSVCGLPFYVSGEVDDWHALAHRDLASIRAAGIDVRLGHRADAIDPIARRLAGRDRAARFDLGYDRVVIATGATPVRPSIPGIDADGVFVLHTMGDGLRLRGWLDERRPSTVLVAGGGYIGVELADALTRRGVRVTLAGRAHSVLPTIDPPLGNLLGDELERNGVAVLTRCPVGAIEASAGRLRVRLAHGDGVPVDGVIVAAGVQPDVALASSAGIELGVRGAIVVTRAMTTSDLAVYAAGDCVETFHALLERPMYAPLGTTAHKQGRVAGINAAGGTASFAGSLGTQVVKVFDLAAARTGLSEADAEAAGWQARTVATTVPDHTRYYPGATDLHIRIVGDAVTGRLLGVQIVGDWRSEVAKRIDIAATAIHEGLRVEGLTRLDLSYTPPVSSPWDPLQVAADAWIRSAPG